MFQKSFVWSISCLVMFSIIFSTTTLAAKKPAVLVYTRGPSRISYPMLQYLNKQGFQVNYTGDIGKQNVPLTWDLAKNYNCIVMLAPEFGGNNRDGGHTSQETAKVLKKFMEAGGGVLQLPLIAWFFDPPWHYLVAIIPTYWPAKAFWVASEGGEYAGYLIVGAIFHIVIILALLKRFRKITEI